MKRNLGQTALTVVEDIGLFVIAVATVVAIGQEIVSMVGRRGVALEDLLLLFIYLEVLAMVSMYLQSGQLPVRLPLYIGMVALARYLVLDMKDMDSARILTVAGGALLLALAVLVLRFGHVRYPYQEGFGRRHPHKGGASQP